MRTYIPPDLKAVEPQSRKTSGQGNEGQRNEDFRRTSPWPIPLTNILLTTSLNQPPSGKHEELLG